MTVASGRDVLQLADDPVSVRAARTFVHRRCSDAGLSPELRDIAVLLTSETVTNAFVHGHSDAKLIVVIEATGVLVGVEDSEPRAPKIGRLDDYEALGGRGLAIVAQLATAWGNYAVPGGGKMVWFRLVEA